MNKNSFADLTLLCSMLNSFSSSQTPDLLWQIEIRKGTEYGFYLVIRVHGLSGAVNEHKTFIDAAYSEIKELLSTSFFWSVYPVYYKGRLINNPK
jgi:hypothetical protein